MAEKVAAAGIAMESDANTGNANELENAGASARVLAYLIDSVVLFCFSSVFLLAAAMVLFIDSDQGRDQISDSEAWAFVGIMVATIPAWLVANLMLGRWLGQTLGQYVMGLRVQEEDGSPPKASRLLQYWLALHPLFYHPLLAGIWLLFAYVGITLADSSLIFVLALALALLCLAAPLANLLFLFRDPQRRTIHDRLVGLRVQRLQ